MPEVEMRKKYPQIKGFFAVSCYTYEVSVVLFK